jgi:nitrogen regulatory protein PII
VKKVEATINPSQVDAIRQALVRLGIDAMSVCDAHAYYPLARGARQRRCDYTVWIAPQMRIQVVMDEDRVASCVAAICRCVCTDSVARGAIIVLPAEDPLPISIGRQETGAA